MANLAFMFLDNIDHNLQPNRSHFNAHEYGSCFR
ncbi:hypothetical protein PSMA108079_01820 [Pseudoalteromonas mariniglutinosa]